METIWKFLQPLIGPVMVIIFAVSGLWAAYTEGKHVGRSGYVDEIAACEHRRAVDHEKLMKEREDLLSVKTEMLEDAWKQLEETENENERLRKIADQAENSSNVRHAALDAALASVRFCAASGACGQMPGTPAAAAALDEPAAECRPCTAELEAVKARAAHDALTVMEWQEFYDAVRKK